MLLCPKSGDALTHSDPSPNIIWRPTNVFSIIRASNIICFKCTPPTVSAITITIIHTKRRDSKETEIVHGGRSLYCNTYTSRGSIRTYGITAEKHHIMYYYRGHGLREITSVCAFVMHVQPGLPRGLLKLQLMHFSFVVVIINIMFIKWRTIFF